MLGAAPSRGRPSPGSGVRSFGALHHMYAALISARCAPSTALPEALPPAIRPQRAATESTGGSRVAAVDQLAPASPDPNTSPDVAPK